MTGFQQQHFPDGLKQLDIADLDRYKRAITAGGQTGFAYYFPYLLTYNRAGRSAILVTEDDGSLCVFRWSGDKELAGTKQPRLDLFLAPMPMNPAVLRRCLQRANDFNGDRKARLLKIDENDAEALAADKMLKVREKKTQYLYAPANFLDISGNRFRTMRRNVQKIEAMQGLEVEPYVPAHSDECLSLLRHWQQHHRTTHGTQGGVGTTRRIIDLAAQLDQPELFGELIRVNGDLAGFAFGGEIRPGYGAFVEAKADINIPGLSYFQRYHFMSKLQQFDLINDGPDIGRSGLAQLKNSLRPVGMHREYRGYQR